MSSLRAQATLAIGLSTPVVEPGPHQLMARARRGGTAHLKAWTILATGYSGLLHKFADTLETITALEIYRTWATL